MSGILLAIVLKLVSPNFVLQESVTQSESALADLRKNLADQQNARAESERKYHLVLAELERMKADHQKLERKAKADQPPS